MQDELDDFLTFCRIERRLAPAGANLRQIQELLGHKHLDSTQRYTRVTGHELRGDQAAALRVTCAIARLRLPNRCHSEAGLQAEPTQSGRSPLYRGRPHHGR